MHIWPCPLMSRNARNHKNYVQKCMLQIIIFGKSTIFVKFAAFGLPPLHVTPSNLTLSGKMLSNPSLWPNWLTEALSSKPMANQFFQIYHFRHYMHFWTYLALSAITRSRVREHIHKLKGSKTTMFKQYVRISSTVATPLWMGY